MTDFVAIARRGVVDCFSESQVSRIAVSAAIDNMVASLIDGMADDPAGNMYAQLAALAWIDGMRCSLCSAREPIDRTESKFWAGQADRATRRYSRIMQSFDHWRRRRGKTR